MKFQKKPVVIDAIQWDGENLSEILHFVGAMCASSDANELTIKTLEGPLHASVGDWIIKGIEGEFYPCKPDIFAKTYDYYKP